jgi:hypothetical protein
MMTASLCTSGHQCVPEVLSRTRKPEQEWVRARVDHMELSYDSKNIIYHVFIYLYCIAFLSTVITVLHDVCFKEEKTFLQNSEFT